MKNVLKPLGKPLATDAAIEKKNFGSSMSTLLFSNEELNDIMKIINFLEDPGLLIKGVSETVDNEIKDQNGQFLGILAATLASSLLENMLARKGVEQLDQWEQSNRDNN